MFSVKRHDNNSYQIVTEEKKINVSAKNLDDQLKVARVVAERFKPEQLELLISGRAEVIVNNQRFLIIKEEHSSTLSYLTNFISPVKNKNAIDLVLEPIYHKGNDAALVGKYDYLDEENLPLWKKEPEAIELTTDVQSMMRNSVEKAFNDPFTLLASRSFQLYHQDYHQKNSSSADFSIYIGILKESDQGLALTYDPQDPALQPHSTTLLLYYSFLLSNWGEQKVRYIEYLFGIDLKAMIEHEEPLTTDIVYQMNIGCSMVEIQDLEQLQLQLQKLKEDLSVFKSKKMTAKDYLLIISKLPLNAIRGLLRQMPSEATLDDLKQKLNTTPLFSGAKPIIEATNQEVNQLISILSFNEEEKKALHTGRPIGPFIGSSYTHAEETKFKPWLDLQEALHTTELLLNNTSWSFFAQECSFVLCKKHLVHRHPEDRYRVGMLIPAPVSLTGEQQWYKVSGHFNNGYGNFSYTLEPFNHNQLPAVKVFRSTASADYALDSKASVRSDINPLSPPGYERVSFLGPYENEFFNQRTVPIWSAYLHQARQELTDLKRGTQHLDPEKFGQKCESIFESLSLSNEALLEAQPFMQQKPRLFEIIQKYDYIILDLLSQTRNFADSKLNKIEKDLFYLILMTMNKQHEQNDDVKDVEEKAKTLFQLIKKAKHPDSKNLLEELHAFDPFQPVSKKQIAESNTFYTQIYSHLKKFKKDYESISEDDTYASMRLAVLSCWSTFLQDYAVSKKEDVSQKIGQSLLITGHSLGSALAQQYCAKQTLASGRVPVPGQKVTLYDYDGPGISLKDNERFITTGNKHKKLLNAMQKPISITRTHAYGDFIVLGGEISLGAALDRAQSEQVKEWLLFDGKVKRLNKEVDSEILAGSDISHAIKFELPEHERKLELTDVFFETIDVEKQSAIYQAFYGQNSDYSWEQVRTWWGLGSLEMNLALFEKHASFLRTTLRIHSLIRHNDIKIEDKLHGLWRNYRDKNGVFAVNNQGVITA